MMPFSAKQLEDSLRASAEIPVLAPAVYQDLSTPHGWLLKKPLFDWPVRWKGNSKRISCNSLSPLGRRKGYAICNNFLRLQRHIEELIQKLDKRQHLL